MTATRLMVLVAGPAQVGDGLALIRRPGSVLPWVLMLERIQIWRVPVVSVRSASAREFTGDTIEKALAEACSWLRSVGAKEVLEAGE